MNRTLVIHPEDRSTYFLSPIYENIPNVTILRSGTREQVEEEILNHDRIMMMGHGSPWGLFSVGRFEGANGYVIDHDTVELLRGTENVFIWCNADKFVVKHNLNGLYSGMFISEVGEANYCGLPGTPQETVDASNHYFAQLLGEVINEPLDVICNHVKENYELLTEGNPVALYNYNRLYLKQNNNISGGKSLIFEI